MSTSNAAECYHMYREYSTIAVVFMRRI